MRLIHSITRAWHRAGITKKFSLSFFLLIFLIAVMLGASCFALFYVRQMEEKILTSVNIERLVLEVDSGMELARRLSGDFFLHAPHIGIAEAHQQYVQPSVRQAARVIALSDELRDLLDRSHPSETLQTPQVDLILYLSMAKRFTGTSIHAVELVTKRDIPVNGLVEQMTSCVNVFGASLVSHPDLLALHLKAKGFFQEYLINHQRPVIQSAFNIASSLHLAIINDQTVLPEEKTALLAMLNQCRSIAEEIVAIDQEIKGAFNDFTIQSATTRMASQSLLQFAQKETFRNYEKTHFAHKAVLIGMSGVFVFCVVILMLLARKVDHDITWNILRMKDRAQELTKGNLDVRCEETGEDELGQLARTFNSMAVHIQELVSTLEDKVVQRTAQLGESEQRFRHLAANLPLIPVQGYDCDRNIIFWNRASESIYGYTAVEAMGRKMEDLIIPQAERANFVQITRDWLDRDIAPPSSELIRRHKNGSLVDVYSSHVMLNSTKGEKEMYGIDIDLAEIKQVQKEKASIEGRLQRAQKMEAIGLMAGGVAHDLNNILSGIVGYPDLILMQWPSDNKLKALVEPIKESGKRAAAIVTDLLTVARGVACVREFKELNLLIEEYIGSPEGKKLQSLYPDINLEVHIEARKSVISCSSTHIKKCLMNLMINAAEAISGPGHIAISTCEQVFDAAMAERKGLAPGRYVVLTLSDSGTGIAADDLARIFEPFYTKKVMGRSGTGLGLSVVWNTVQDHNGCITVNSSEKGTSFELSFPLVNNNTVINNDKKEQSEIVRSGNGGLVLVVDDEPQLLDIARQSLEMFGYSVKTARSGEDAIVFLQNNKADLVLLDMLMDPGMNGRETYEQILKIYPRQKAIIVSGYSESDEVKMALKLGAKALLKKPYTVKQLNEVVLLAMPLNNK